MRQKDNTQISRRGFVKCAATAAACASAPIFLHAEDKAAAKPIVLGSGRHTYELIPGWGKLPNGARFGYTHGIAVDAQNRVFVFNQSKDAMVIFDEDGRFIKSWNHDYDRGAHGLTLVKENEGEFLYLTDYELHRAYKTTLDGQILWTLGAPPLGDVYKDPSRYRPTNTGIVPNGDVYVSDGYGQNYIHHYNAKAEYQGSFGGPGRDQGKLNCPHGIFIDRRGENPVVLVADRANVRLQTFTLSGQPIAMFDKDLRHPCHFDTRDGDLLIPDLHGRVTIVDKDNKLIAHLGDTPGVEKMAGYPNLPREQRIPGKFISPHSACWDQKGDLYVVEWISDGRLTKYRHVA